MVSCCFFMCIADGEATVCPDCHHELSHPKKPTIPNLSLVRCDPGRRPPHLPPLTRFEAGLLAPIKPYKQVMMFKRASAQNPSHHKYRGHVIAIPNPPAPHVFKATYSATPTEAHATTSPADAPVQPITFPLPLEQIPQHFNIVFVNPATTKEQVHNMARNAPAVQVRLLLSMHGLLQVTSYKSYASEARPWPA
jgi:hypothetical protein